MVKRCQWLWAAWIALAVSGAQAAGTKAEAGNALSQAAAADSAVPGSSAEDLSANQHVVAGEFNEFQSILLKIRDQVRQTDPARAELIEKVLKESGERHVAIDFQEIVDLLRRDKFGDAARKQGKVNEDLDAILKLLLNEDRRKSETAGLKQWLKTVNGLLAAETGLRNENASGDNPKSLAGPQGTLARRTGNLAKDLAERGAKGGGNGKGEPGQGQPQPGQGKGGDDQEDSPKQDAHPGNPPQEETPLRKSLKAAEDDMQKAEDELKKANKDGSLKDQADAINNLQIAKETLESILKQRREKEINQILAALEARFKKILQIQREIYGSTVRLDKIPLVERSHAYEIDTGHLSNREAEIVMEVETALSQLREEGSSVATPEAVQEVRDDMQQLVHRLAEGKTEELTQNIEKDVINALQLIVDALHNEQRETKKGRSGKPSPSGQPQDPPLIELLTELKLIRSMQLGVNRRTARYSKLIPEGQGNLGQATKEDLLDALRRLGEKEARLHEVTRELELGLNR